MSQFRVGPVNRLILRELAMKIVERNSERLVLKRGPSLAALLFSAILTLGILFGASQMPPEQVPAMFGIAVVCGTVMLLFGMSRAQTLSMDRRMDELYLSSWTMLGPRVLKMPLGGLGGATVQVVPGSGGMDLRPALMLQSERGPKEHPLSRNPVSRAETDRLIGTINDWLAGR